MAREVVVRAILQADNARVIQSDPVTNLAMFGIETRGLGFLRMLNLVLSERYKFRVAEFVAV